MKGAVSVYGCLVEILSSIHQSKVCWRIGTGPTAGFHHTGVTHSSGEFHRDKSCTPSSLGRSAPWALAVGKGSATEVDTPGFSGATLYRTQGFESCAKV